MWKLNLSLLLLLLFVGEVTAIGQEDQTSPPASAPTSQVSGPPPGSPTDKAPPQSALPPGTDAPKLDLTPDAHRSLSQQQMQQLFRVVADKDQENDKRQRDYTYVERDVDNHLDGKGKVKSTEIKTYEVMEIYGEQVNRLIEKDDKPLSEKDAAKEEEKIRKITEKRKNESENDQRKREQKEGKDREEGRKFVNEVADAYNFKLVATESVGGRETWVIDAEPRPGFVPHLKESKFLSKLRGRVWVDKQDLQLAKVDVEALDTITFGVFLARLHKGAHFTLEQTRVNDEVWLPLHLMFNIDARVALLKDFRIAGEQTFHDYKKFRTSTKILGYGEVQKP